MGLSHTVFEIKGDALDNRKFFLPLYLTPLLTWFLGELYNGGGAQKTTTMPTVGKVGIQEGAGFRTQDRRSKRCVQQDPG